MIFDDLSATAITTFHNDRIEIPQWAKKEPARQREGVWCDIELNHRYNSLLWNEEDQARRRD